MRRSLVLASLLLSGCAALGPNKPIVENRFRTAADWPLSEQPVLVDVSTADPESSGIAITQLSDRAQAALVEQSKGKPPLQLKAEPKWGAVVMRSSLRRRVIVSVRPKEFLPPGDRVDAIRVELKISPGQANQWRIAGWTQASNGDRQIDVGKITGVTASKIGGSTGLKIWDLLPDLTVSGERSQSETQEMPVRDLTKLNAAVDVHGKAWLEEIGGWRDDLAHNLSMDVVVSALSATLKPEQLAAVSSLAKEEAPTPAAEVRVRQVTIYAPLESQLSPVCGEASLSYRIRHISNPLARRTFSEADDDVEYISRSTRTPFVFAPPPYQATYDIETAPHRPLHYKIGVSEELILRFSSLEEATAFRDWLRVTAPAGGKLANATLGTFVGSSFRPMSAADFRHLVVTPANGQALRDAAAFDPASCGTAKQ